LGAFFGFYDVSRYMGLLSQSVFRRTGTWFNIALGVISPILMAKLGFSKDSPQLYYNFLVYGLCVHYDYSPRWFMWKVEPWNKETAATYLVAGVAASFFRPTVKGVLTQYLSATMGIGNGIQIYQLWRNPF
jgi:hypothetical protein